MSVIEMIRDKGALFNVREDKLQTMDGLIVPGKKAIINERTSEVIGVVGKNYRVVTNQEVVENLSEALDNSDLDLTGVEVDVKQSHGGARSMINLRLPAHEVQMPGDTSGSQLQISVLNSYDGRWKYQSRAGAIRMACLNGQILGSFVGSYTEYHNQRLDVKRGAEQLTNMAQDFEQSKEWWIAMMGRKIDNEALYRAIAIFLTGKTKIDDREAFKGLPTVKRLVDLYETYAVEMGANAYALYNALTDYVTHKKYKDETHAASLLWQQQRLQETIGKVKAFSF